MSSLSDRGGYSTVGLTHLEVRHFTKTSWLYLMTCTENQNDKRAAIHACVGVNIPLAKIGWFYMIRVQSNNNKSTQQCSSSVLGRYQYRYLANRSLVDPGLGLDPHNSDKSILPRIHFDDLAQWPFRRNEIGFLQYNNISYLRIPCWAMPLSIASQSWEVLCWPPSLKVSD